VSRGRGSDEGGEKGVTGDVLAKVHPGHPFFSESDNQNLFTNAPILLANPNCIAIHNGEGAGKDELTEVLISQKVFTKSFCKSYVCSRTNPSTCSLY